jgi:NDP-sugar pyrophosphorylase family protein
MSGFGERFRRAGYCLPKPLIEIDGKPIIAHVIDMFFDKKPKEKNFIFVCNQDHLDNPSYNMKAIIQKYCPNAQIIGIKPHKLGPIHAVQKVSHLIDQNIPAIVNYCDFTCYWNWNHFKKFVTKTACLGAIPAYKGFHPHSLGNTNYAYLKEIDGWVQAIQEKQPYTNNKMEEFASSGTYYFSSGKIMNQAFEATIKNNLNLNGEYYVSLAYNHLLSLGGKNSVAVYPLQHFMQWGTPEDVAEYNGWSKAFRNLIKGDIPNSTKKSRLLKNKKIIANESIHLASSNSKFTEFKQSLNLIKYITPSPKPSGSLIIPMAGLGQRFADEGYKITKPLILVSGKPMVIQATQDLPASINHSFILRNDMIGCDEISKKLKKIYSKSTITIISGLNDGQACSASIGLKNLENATTKNLNPVTFAACDNGMLYDLLAFQKMVNDPKVDVIVWAARNHTNAMRNPKMFGWISSDENGKIDKISVKTPLSSSKTEPIVIGTFTFCDAKNFHKVFDNLVARDGRINGEFYIDSCINDALELDLNCYLFEVDSFLSWGTPNDLKTFEYWQSCFHKWSSHPYLLDLDKRISDEALPSLKKLYRANTPKLPKLKWQNLK